MNGIYHTSNRQSVRHGQIVKTCIFFILLTLIILSSIVYSNMTNMAKEKYELNGTLFCVNNECYVLFFKKKIINGGYDYTIEKVKYVPNKISRKNEKTNNKIKEKDNNGK